MSDQRIQYDGDELDEIVADGVTVHIEGMDQHHFMIRIYRPERIYFGVTTPAIGIHLSGADLFEVEETTGLPVIQRPAIDWCHVWNDRRGREHKCFEYGKRKGHTLHRCSCGATTKQVAA